jgi:hypothetical protein
MLEFFRPDHGHEQIHEKQQRYDANNDRFHLSSYSFSQSSVYSAPTIKNATTVPTKIKSLTRLLLHLFTEPRVQPVHTQNQNNTDDDEFAHKIDLTMSELWRQC